MPLTKFASWITGQNTICDFCELIWTYNVVKKYSKRLCCVYCIEYLRYKGYNKISEEKFLIEKDKY